MRNRSPRRPRSTPAVLTDTMELVWEFSPPVVDEEGQEVQAPMVREQDWQRMRVNIALEIETAFTTSRIAGGTRVGDYLYDFSKMHQTNLVVGTVRLIRRRIIVH